MVTRFYPNNPDIINVIRRHWNIIQFSDDCNHNFTRNPMLGLRKQPNLSNLLCRAKVQYPPKTKNKQSIIILNTATLALCKYCPKINKRAIKITSTGRNFFSKFKPKLLQKKKRIILDLGTKIGPSTWNQHGNLSYLTYLWLNTFLL
jgi:hypothetical protein